MWTCPKCDRIFEKANQPHSCRKIPLEQHFKNKDKARDLFDYLIKQIDASIGKCRLISLPCCVHLFSHYDFLAVLPKKDRLEIRFALNRQLDTPRVKVCVPLSTRLFKNCLDITSVGQIDTQLMDWLTESYNQK